MNQIIFVMELRWKTNVDVVLFEAKVGWRVGERDRNNVDSNDLCMRKLSCHGMGPTK